MKKKIIEEIGGLRNQLEREVGIEIEMEGQNIQVRVPGWTRTEDGSLRGESAEYVLTKPVLSKDVNKLLSRLRDRLAANGAILTPSDRCGVHIHINCQNMTCEEVIKFAILYLVVENILVKWCGEDREGNLFCLRAKDAEYLIQCMTAAVQNNDLSYIHSANVRYASINFNSLRKFGSLEFRALRTPEDFTRINKWVKMLVAIKNASLKYEEARHIIEDVSMKEPDVFLRDIFGPLSEELSKDKALLWDGVRRVQEVAYASFFIPEKAKGLENLPVSYWNKLYDVWSYLKRNWGEHVRLIRYNPITGFFHFIHDGRPEQNDQWDPVPNFEREFDSREMDWSHQQDYELAKRTWETLNNVIQPIARVPGPDAPMIVDELDNYNAEEINRLYQNIILNNRPVPRYTTTRPPRHTMTPNVWNYTVNAEEDNPER